MKIVGLTGGIASGKSLCTAALRSAGIPVIDCDAIAQEVTRKNAWGWSRVKAAFQGQDVFNADGSINRDKLSALIFADPELRKRLNKATHFPILAQILLRLLLHWACCRPCVVVDMPLLFETGFDRFTSPNVLVHCTPEQQLERLQARNGLSEGEAKEKIGSQMPVLEKLEKATYMVDNSGSIEATEEQVLKLKAILTRTSLGQRMLSPLGLCLMCFAAIKAFQ